MQTDKNRLHSIEYETQNNRMKTIFVFMEDKKKEENYCGIERKDDI